MKTLKEKNRDAEIKKIVAEFNRKRKKQFLTELLEDILAIRKKNKKRLRANPEDFEEGWENFPRGTRVEVLTGLNIWRKGTVVDGYSKESERGINVLCDNKWHKNMNFYEGRGAGVPVYGRTRHQILAKIRLCGEPKRKICNPAAATIKLKGNAAKLLQIAKIAAKYSDGRLRLAYNEETNSTTFNQNSGRFLKLDERRLGQDLESYWMHAEGDNWPNALGIFYEEVIMPIKKNLPKSYAAVWEKLLKLGERIYPTKTWVKWRELLKVK